MSIVNIQIYSNNWNKNDTPLMLKMYNLECLHIIMKLTFAFTITKISLNRTWQTQEKYHK
jgi:hypothetical protein